MSVTAAAGFTAAGAAAGLKKDGALDFGAVVSCRPATTAAVFTSNQLKAAPVLLSQQHLSESGGVARVLLANSKCANACTGEDGVRAARRVCQRAATLLDIPACQILPASTGVIGVLLPEQALLSALPPLLARTARNRGEDFAQAILTTDTFSKQALRHGQIEGKPFTIGGCCKGSGMIAPEMVGPHATMLGFITTDAGLDAVALQNALEQVTRETFNRVIVDGDTSTNDSVYLMANGAAGVQVTRSEDFALFLQLLREVCDDLARALVRDGEGATKFIRIEVEGASSEAEAEEVGKTIARSPLVKTAFFGQDANWGRIAAAVGYARAKVEADKISVSLRDRDGWLELCRHSLGLVFDEARASRILAEKEIVLRVGVGPGPGKSVVYTCDLSYDYVRINGDYRS